MDIVFPFEEPIEVAKFLRPQDLKRQITLIKKVIDKNDEYYEWFSRVLICYEKYVAGEKEQAGWWSNHALLVKPDEITEDTCEADRLTLIEISPKAYDYSKPRKTQKA